MHRKLHSPHLAVIRVAFALTAASCAPRPHVEPPRRTGFYSKSLSYGELRVAAHASVPDEALEAARNRLEEMLGHAPQLRLNLEENEVELHIMGRFQFPSDLPEHAAGRGTRLPNGEPFDGHMRGGHLSGRFASCTEGSLLGYVTDLHFGENVCAHEIAHAVHEFGLGRTGWEQLEALYRAAGGRGRWLTPYAATNVAEYFAEGTRLYFSVDGAWTWGREDLGRGRGRLRETDPEMFLFLDGLYSGRFDPGPFVAIATAPSQDDGPPSPPSSTIVRVVVTNALEVPVRVVWVDFEGQRDAREDAWTDVAPGAVHVVVTFRGHRFLALGADGAPLCAFQAADENGRVVLAPPSCARSSR